MVRLNETVGQPWRYECPHCSTYDVVRIHSATKVSGKQYPCGQRGKAQSARDRAIDWRCNQCGQRLTEVYDTKNDGVVSTQVVQ